MRSFTNQLGKNKSHPKVSVNYVTYRARQVWAWTLYVAMSVTQCVSNSGEIARVRVCELGWGQCPEYNLGTFFLFVLLFLSVICNCGS